jgi:pyridoxal phosphate enzyme (YggS family)
MTLKARLDEIETRMVKAAHASGRRREDITLVAVSKFQPLALIQEAIALGLNDFGENYAQELVEKALALPKVRWHFIGKLQKNKINMLRPHVAVWQTIDSVEAAQAVTSRVDSPIMYLQVNIGNEPQKNGIAEADVERVLGTQIAGLMCIPPAGDAVPYFQRMRALHERCEALAGRKLALSMGMSDDFEAAITHGATHVRIGTRLFGSRS